jgi:hypothetical protein
MSMRRVVRFWKGLDVLLLRFCRERGLAFNRVVNLAVQSFLGGCDVERLRLEAELEGLLREESRLRRVSNVMLRSGAYLPSYVVKVLRKPGGLSEVQRRGELPLEVLADKREVQVFLKIAQKREMVAKRICEIQEQLLRDVEPFKVPGEGSRVKKAGEGGEKPNG